MNGVESDDKNSIGKIGKIIGLSVPQDVSLIEDATKLRMLNYF